MMILAIAIAVVVSAIAIQRAIAARRFVERVERELREAREIQQSLVPKIVPRCDDCWAFELSAALEPARGVGGDLYDFFWIDDRRFFFMIGDVSEKGVPAALIMAVVRTLVKSSVQPRRALCDVLAAVNDELSQGNSAMMIVTLFACIIDAETGELEYCDAGHNPPYLLPRGAPPILLVKRPGIALGLTPGFRFRSEKMELRRGDGIFLYTDGITEAMNTARDVYTEERLARALDGATGEELRLVVQRVLSDVAAFRRAAPQSDDIAMLVLRRKDEGEPRPMA